MPYDDMTNRQKLPGVGWFRCEFSLTGQLAIFMLVLVRCERGSLGRKQIASLLSTVATHLQAIDGKGELSSPGNARVASCPSPPTKRKRRVSVP